MIRSFRVKNYRCLHDVGVIFEQPITALVGPNNAGKSSLLEALRDCFLLGSTNLPDIFRGLHAYNLVHTMGVQNPMEFEISLDSGGHQPLPPAFIYRLALIGREPGGWMEVQEERLLRKETGQEEEFLLLKEAHERTWSFLNEKEKSGKPFNANPAIQGVMQLFDREAHRGVLDFRAKLSSFLFFDLQPQALKTASEIQPRPVLSCDGGNLAAVLDSLAGEDPGSFRRLQDELKTMVPEIAHLLFRTIEGGRKFLAIQENYGPDAIPSLSASDGVLKFIALLTILHSCRQPTVILLEEPENNIHPRRLEQVVESFRVFTQRDEKAGLQIIMSTHSPYLVDKLRPEELLIVERGPEGTKVQPVPDRDRVHELLEDAPLGELWHRGSLGGVPKP